MTRRGFTLLEALIVLVILSFLVAGISTVLLKQSQASARQTQQRDLERNGRLAVLELSHAVRLAGYGITPVGAFDFDRYACTTPGTGTTCPGGGRDRIDGPDEMVVSWRDPSFFRSATAITGAGPWTVTLNAALTGDVNAGRIVQMLCLGAEPSVYLALQSDAHATDTQMVLRQLTNADGYYQGLTSAGTPNNSPTSDGCFATGGVMLVERTRYFIANDTDGVPSLFRERGRGAAELMHRGIEDVQYTWDIGQPPAGSAFAAGGATPAAAPACAATLWTFGTCAAAATPSEAATAPDWRLGAYDSANRYTGHPSNIRNVNIFIVARSTQPSPDNTGDSVPVLANRPARVADRFHRTVVNISEQPQNLLVRAHFLPPVFTNSNVGGG